MMTNSDDSREDSGAQSSRQPFPSSGSAAYDSVHATPAKKMGANEFAEHEPADLDSCRQRLVHGLEDRGKLVGIPRLLDILGLYTLYTAYDKSIPSCVFDGIDDDEHVVDFKQKADSKKKPEAAYADTFKRVLDKLTTNANNATVPVQYRKSPYMYMDYQNRAVPGSTLKPDLAFFQDDGHTPNIATACILLEAKTTMPLDRVFRDYLGQIASYALEIWKRQPTRTFAPILLLLGCQLHLAVFTRNGYYKATIGQVMYQHKEDVLKQSRIVGQALRQLWFLLTLPVDKLGLLNTATATFEYLRIDTSACPATLMAVEYSAIMVTNSIEQRMPIIGRCAHLFRVVYGTKPAVLKLAWTRKNRLPEGAVYEVLSTKDGDGNPPVSGIPQIYASGILAKDVDGYRLEFLIMEDCGEPIVGHFAKLRETKIPADKFAQAVKCCVESVMQTLVEARHVSVLHRDISAGNIAIKNGRAYVIDWGYAKLLCPPNEPLDTTTAKRLKEGGSYKDGFAKRWEMDWDEVIATETAKDPFTGTSLYMSIQVLLQAPQRSIFNDVESLFYIVLDALSKRDRTGKKKSTPGFAFFSSESMALMRIAILLGEQGYLSDFGVDIAASPILANMLAAMYKFLFYEGDRYIGGKLRDNYQRQFDPTEAGGFMNAKTLTLFNGSNELVKETPNSPQNTEALGAVDSNSGGGGENVAPIHNVANMPYTPTARGTRSKSGARPPGPNTPWAPVPFPPVATASDKKRAQNEESTANTDQSPKRRKSSDHMDVVDGTDEPSDSN